MSTITPTPQTQPATNAPPLPWVNQPEFDLAGAGIGLVYLSDLVKWLKESNRLSFKRAVRVLYEALTSREDVVLYVANKGGAACAVGSKHQFDPYANLRNRRRFINPGVRLDEYGPYTTSSRNSAPALPPVPTGQAAALDYVDKVWGNGENLESVMGYENTASLLAMTCGLAAAIWGGAASVAAVAAIESTKPQPTAPAAGEVTTNDLRKKVRGAAWTDAQNTLLVSDFKAAKGKTVKAQRATVGELWGLGPDAIKKQLDSIKKKTPKANKSALGWGNQLGKR